MPLCPGCFEKRYQPEGCPDCGYQDGARRSSLLLPHGTLLRNQYLLGNVLGNPGGFGITYLGYNQKLECKVAIKEFLPREIAGRGLDGVGVEVHTAADAPVFAAGLDQFLQEARLLAKFSHPNIVRVIDFFEENGTAYLVMDYYSGVTLVEYVAKHGGMLSEQAALDILLPVCDGLREIHANGILHRDIKPQNIYITTQGRPILLDFGAARQTVEALSQGFSLLITPGFAPVEQYDRQGRQGPWTDVYGCAATLYYMLTGHAPPDAISRMTRDSFQPAVELCNRSPGLLRALQEGLALLPEQRLPDIAGFQGYLSDQTLRMAKSHEAATQLLPARPLPIPPRQTTGGREETAELPAEPARLRPAWRGRNALLLVLAVLAGIGIWYFQHTPARQLERQGIAFTEEAFFQAVRTGNQEIVRLFLAAGYQPDQAESGSGTTAVMAAIEAGQLAVVSDLISRGANLERQDAQGRKPIDIALRQGNLPVIKLLLDRQQRAPDSADEQGRTLLERAILAGNPAAIRFVVEQGADVNAVDGQGNTLLDRALADGDQPAALLLKSLGAKRNVNKGFIRGQLNAISLPAGDTASFEIDLLGNGLAQQVSFSKLNSSRAVVTFTEDGRLLAEYGNVRAQRWYAAYLRDDHTPDLIHFRLVGADFLEEIRIIGRTGKGTIEVLFAPDLGALRAMGLLRGQAGIQLEGRQIILYSGKNRAAVEWLPEQQSFRMRKL